MCNPMSLSDNTRVSTITSLLRLVGHTTVYKHVVKCRYSFSYPCLFRNLGINKNNFTPRRIYPRERTLLPSEWEARLVPRRRSGRFGQHEESPAPAGIRTLDHTARSLVTIPITIPRPSYEYAMLQ